MVYPDTPPNRGAAVIPIKPRIPSITIYSPSISVHTSEEERQILPVLS